MFRHKQAPELEAEKPENTIVESVSNEADLSDQTKTMVSSGGRDGSIKELIEKNLKWSQIIYEQNRKINSKLLWIAVAGWIKILVILVPIIFAVLFLPPLLKNFWSQYGDLLGGGGQTAGGQAASFESIIKLFNLNPAQQEQLKALLK